MGGLLALFLIAIYLWASLSLIVFSFNNFNKTKAIIVTLIILIIPIADHLIGKSYLKHQCKVKTNIVLKRSVPNIDGLNIDYGAHPESVIFYGYKFIEGDGWGGIRRVTRDSDPKWGNDPKYAITEEKLPYRTSKYTLEEKLVSSSRWFLVTRYIVRSLSDESDVLGYFDWYSFRGGWVERTLYAFSDAGPSGGGSCEDYKVKDKRHTIKKLLNSTLQPSK